MKIEKYTEKSKEVISEAQNYAIVNDHQRLEALHLLHALLVDDSGMIHQLCSACGLDAAALIQKVENQLNTIPKVVGLNAQQFQASTDTIKVFAKAEELAKKSDDTFVTLERLLQAIIQIKSSAQEILLEAGLTDAQLTEFISTLRKGKTADTANAEQILDALSKYAEDLTQKALDGNLDPVIGRDEEIRRAMQILSRRTKNNPVLIGEPGTGKTAIAEGIASRIASGDIPDNLKNTKLMSLDLGALIAGAKYRGEFEERLKAVLSEIEELPEQTVIFIDELHTLVGAGKTDGAMDASNLLKPALARGDLHCIGATTLDEYRQYIEKDAALARRFQTVYINEPSIEDTVSILRGLKEKYEVHHGIRISDAAIIAAAKLSDRYINDRFLPDKAIDLVDEAASRLRMQVNSRPESIDELNRKVMQLKIELEALKKENDDASKERVLEITKNLDGLEKELADLDSAWSAAKAKITAANELKEKLDNARFELEQAQRSGNLGKAGELSYGLIPQLEAEIKTHANSQKSELIREEVLDEDIAHVVSKWTGIPVDKMLTGEKDKLISMETELHQYVIGQHEAIQAISETVRRSRAGLQATNRPIGSFLFLGPTGVGKTEICKSLSQFLFNDKSAMLRIDMSEYMEKHAVSRLIGAPPGYVGYDEGGVLTEGVRRRPYQVILFDEIEKAHPDVFNILLQILDDGRLTDSHGKTVDFTNTIIVLTSNLGSHYLSQLLDNQDTDLVKDQVMDEVKQAFRPEFLNRLDEIILFSKLKRAEMTAILQIQLNYLQELLDDKQIKLNLSDEALEFIANKGYSPEYGARPLKRVIQKDIQNVLANKILSGELTPHSTVTITLNQDNELVFTSSTT